MIYIYFLGSFDIGVSNTLILKSRQQISENVNTDSNYLNQSIQKGLKCSFCSAIFISSILLQQHMQIHSGFKYYVCSVCKKGFSTKQNLTIHFRIHTGEKPFKCNVCDHTSNHLSNLKKHVVTKHGFDSWTSLHL